MQANFKLQFVAKVTVFVIMFSLISSRYRNSFTSNCDFLDFKMYLLNWQTSCILQGTIQKE